MMKMNLRMARAFDGGRGVAVATPGAVGRYDLPAMSGTATSGHLAAGRLTEQREGLIVLSVPGSDYRLHLAVERALGAAVGDKLTGTIRVVAKRIDVVPSGGRYVEPVYGRPRRVQGRVVATDAGAGTITVHAGVPVVAKVNDARQNAGQFSVGDLVSFDAEPGARFEPTT